MSVRQLASCVAICSIRRPPPARMFQPTMIKRDLAREARCDDGRGYLAAAGYPMEVEFGDQGRIAAPDGLDARGIDE